MLNENERRRQSSDGSAACRESRRRRRHSGGPGIPFGSLGSSHRPALNGWYQRYLHRGDRCIRLAMRLVISFAAAWVVTLALFYLMQSLISGEVRNHDQLVQTTDIRLVTLHRASGAGTGTGTGTGGQSQPPAPAAAAPSASEPVRTDSNETQSTSLPPPSQEIELPLPAVAPVDAPPVRGGSPVTVAKKPLLPQTKPKPSGSKAPIPPPTPKNAKNSSIDKKKSPEALPAALPAKPPAALPEEFRPRLAAGRESQVGAGSGSGGNDAGTPGKSPIGSPSKGAGAGSGPAGSDTGGPGNSPVGILSKTRPVYPRDALQRGQEGWVKVSFTITEQGRIENPAVVSSRPRQIFDQAALEAIMQWRFRPKMVSGKPVQTLAIQEIRFTLPQ